MAITSETIIEYSVQTDKINSIIFNDFIQNIIIKHKIKGNTFVFDNVSFHKNKQMLDFITNSGNFYLFTPPYSPNNNPIENMFGIIKSEFSKQIISDIIDKNILSKKEYKLIKQDNKIKLIEKNKQDIIEIVKNNKKKINDIKKAKKQKSKH